MMFRVTAVWNDGLDLIEEHATWTAAVAFASEAMGCDSMAKVTIEKVNV